MDKRWILMLYLLKRIYLVNIKVSTIIENKHKLKNNYKFLYTKILRFGQLHEVKNFTRLIKEYNAP